MHAYPSQRTSIPAVWVGSDEARAGERQEMSWGVGGRHRRWRRCRGS